ncbi:hypothetical protein M493_11195 [Geobacillus genomosp. 3]|uniref:Uncharacterized protein n=1 Tax=Geobacillus genomosp. 3 TaxID=1921421 RepID=S5Z0I0_GEOG3|nr:hypothetical protein M493_11195 [Geobacillus genomosp. 3]
MQSKDGNRQKKKRPARGGDGKKQICIGGVGGQICYEMVGQTCYNREEAQLRWQLAASPFGFAGSAAEA